MAAHVFVLQTITIRSGSFFSFFEHRRWKSLNRTQLTLPHVHKSARFEKAHPKKFGGSFP